MAPSYPSPSLRAEATTPRTGPQKGVTIFEEPEHIPEPSFKVTADDPNQENGASPTLVGSHSPKLHRASISGKKMTGRPAVNQANSSSSTAPLTKAMSYFSLDDSPLPEPNTWPPGGSTTPGTTPGESKTPDLRNILSQVADWLQEEKTRRQKHKHARQHHPHPQPHRDQNIHTPEIQPGEAKVYDTTTESEQDVSLDKLESILQSFSMDGFKLPRKLSSSALRRSSIAKKFKQPRSVPVSSDTEFFGDDILVPSVEAKLDNSKTMAYTGGSGEIDTTDKAKKKDYEHWVTFKEDILRLTHTLKLKGWRRIPIDQAADIDVARLSGALTNAVYVVHPPKVHSEPEQLRPSDSSLAPASAVKKRRPRPLLLRIYGPQVEHLIDRDAELNILRRLAQKRIGPSLLGCFDNGRFEEFLHAKTLTAADLRIPETSKQIAKRMRELHDGIELLEAEFSAGPATFVNWDKWVDRVEKVITFLDAQYHQAEEELKAGTSRRNSVVNLRYVRRGLICGVEWPVFRRTYDMYRKRLLEDSGGISGVCKQLVFSHNDTQYGNLMRLQPSGTSPLLQPSNHHKQLVVIDFEYAAQNVPGLEFANHFTEWCYNYHQSIDKSFVCDTRKYPTEHEQYRFVRSYVMHRPQFNPAASATPKMEAREKTNISDFMLDARTPGGGSANSGGSGYIGGGGAVFDYDKEESEREKAQEEEIQRLLQQARVWRLANSAMWVAWGIVQAKVPELDALEEKEKLSATAKKVTDAIRERRRSITEKVVEKVKKVVGGKDQSGPNLHPMSDALTEVESRIREESQWDRPEARQQEEAHHEGDGSVVIEEDKQQSATADVAINGDVSHESPPEEETAVATTTENHEEEQEEEEEEDFDYLGYAQERAMFFWGDCIQMGLVKEEELPDDLRAHVKMVPY